MSMWDNLRKVIETQVERDGIRKDAILSFEIEQEVAKRAADYIYDDVSEFFYWIFNPEDEFSRYQYLQIQPTTGKRFEGPKYELIRKVVKPIVEDNLDAMRKADEITPEQDVAGLTEKLTDQLTAYIINWQDWFYDRKMDDDIDAYYEWAAEYHEIYDEDVDDEYGDFTNLLDDSQYDGISDVPYLSDREP